MHKIIISLICCLLPALAWADAPGIRDNAPDRHVVVKGDTLWSISAEFFKDPWKWPQIWGMNKDTIKDPHWIYPGDVIALDRATGTLHVGESAASAASVSAPNDVVKLSPQVRVERSEHDAIPSIPTGDIAPFLSQPLVVEQDGLETAPILVGADEQRVILGSGDIAYVKGLSEGKGNHWQIFRPGKALVDPDTKQVLGYEAIYLGDANVEKFADPSATASTKAPSEISRLFGFEDVVPRQTNMGKASELSTIRITKSLQEINTGDRLAQAPSTLPSNFVPHAPNKQITARVISIYGGVSQAGQNTVITINKGRRDGLEDGNVLALYRKGEHVGYNLTLPDTRYGLLFVFRTFDKVAYALVMQTTLPVELLDRAQTP